MPTLDLQIDYGQHEELTHAILLYGEGKFAMVHQCYSKRGGVHLGEGMAINKAFLATALRKLTGTGLTQLVPPNVVICGTDAIAWWSPAKKRQMLFHADRKMVKLQGLELWHPPLLWYVTPDQLFLFALEKDKRPDADTPLLIAPYWNVDGSGLVCQGNMPRPDHISCDTIGHWEQGFFGSLFTHPNVGLRWAKGVTFEQLWLSAKTRRFDTKRLARNNKTLGGLLDG